MSIDFSIIQFIVFAGLLLTVVNIFLHIKFRLNTQFTKVVQLLNFFLAIHFTFVWLVETVFTNGKSIDAMAPFLLVYGTFLYLCNYLTRNESISFKLVLPHLLIPVIFWIWFFIVLLKGTDHIDMTIINARRPVSIVSLLGYIFAIIFFNKKPMLKQYRFVRPLIIFGSIALLILVIIAIKLATAKTVTSNELGAISIRSIVYLCMLACAIMIFRMQLSLLNPRASSQPREKSNKPL